MTQSEDATLKTAMDSDRVLLEKAARAAGMYVLPEPWPDTDGWFFCMQHGKPALHFRKVGNLHAYAVPWMPLTDDGDALRLAVKLQIDVCFFPGFREIHAEPASVDQYGHATEGYAEDMSAAVRRAIVRAAAEVDQVGRTQ